MLIGFVTQRFAGAGHQLLVALLGVGSRTEGRLHSGCHILMGFVGCPIGHPRQHQGNHRHNEACQAKGHCQPRHLLHLSSPAAPAVAQHVLGRRG